MPLTSGVKGPLGERPRSQFLFAETLVLRKGSFSENVWCILPIQRKIWSILINTIFFLDFHELPLASKKLDIIIWDPCKRISRSSGRVYQNSLCKFLESSRKKLKFWSKLKKMVDTNKYNTFCVGHFCGQYFLAGVYTSMPAKKKHGKVKF